ncbi:MAG: hypothetical protein JNK45_09105 [Myxococcales bacterium]|nr:hypothetical protein [Myxococcales bacterium]
MVVLGSARLVCPHCGQVQYHPLARRYRCRACSKVFTAAAARPMPRRALGRLLLGLGACTMDNPAFGDANSGTSNGSGGSASASASSAGTSADSAATTAVDTVDPDVSGSAEAESSGDGHGETGPALDMPGACTLPEPIDLHIEINGLTEPPGPQCTATWGSEQGAITVEGDTIFVWGCECPCEPNGQITYEVKVTGVDLVGLPLCGEVVSYSRDDGDACIWDVVTVRGAPDSGQPRFVAARSLVLPSSVLGELSVQLGEDIPCGTGRCEKSGEYALRFTDGMFSASIAPDDDPVLAPLPSLEGASFELDTVSAIVDDACDDHLIWTARSP